MVANQGSCGAAEESSRSESNLNVNSAEQGGENGINGINKEPVKVLTLSTTNPHILAFRAMEYAARGPVITRAISLEQELALMKQNGTEPEFLEIVKMNLGDAHAMGQKPITFVRQVLALISCPDLIEVCNFNEDVKNKAVEILSSCRGGSAGSYSDSRGMQIIRDNVAKYIERRDGGVSSSADNIVLSAGASEGIRACLKLLKTGSESHATAAGDHVSDKSNQIKKKAGVLIPVPEYPLYSATLEEYDMKKVAYYLDEHKSGWTVNVEELETIVHNAKDNCEPRAIVVINPGNPTGHVLTKENIEAIIRFAYKQRLVIIADEVYQNNVYLPKKFVSFKKVLSEMSSPFNSVELISVHSCSKGFVCECGLRAGYFEVVNMDPEVKSVLTASVAANLCPTVLGQAVVDCLVDPPKPGEPSYELFMHEKSIILGNLAERADMVHKELNKIPGVSCARLDGAMYAFPQIHLPEKAIELAKEAGMEPDVFYCLNLLESTGICVVPGSGMGQKSGTYHFRTTILAPTKKMKIMLEKFRIFHMGFIKRYS